MSEIEKAFQAGYRAYREAFDHYDDFDDVVEHSLKWLTEKYIAAQQLPTTNTCSECLCDTHLTTDGRHVCRNESCELYG